jgi:MFS family permease
LTGIGCGAITAAVPSYIAELSIPSIRGILTGFFECAYQIGSLIGFWINYGITQNMSATSSTSWRVPMAVQLIPGCILLVGGFFLHESPLWLMRKERHAEAHQALETLRKLPIEHEYLQQEVRLIQNRLNEEASVASKYGTGSWAFFRGAMDEFSRRGMRNRVFLVFCSFALQNFAGAAGMYSSFKILNGCLLSYSDQLLLPYFVHVHWNQGYIALHWNLRIGESGSIAHFLHLPD